MDLDFIIVLFLIGFFGSFISGMVGIGGSIIKYPLLLYVPTMLGVGSLSAAEVAGISAVQVFFATIGGVWAFRKDGYLNKALILSMGISVLVGSFIGGFGSNLLTDNSINFVYAIMATIAAIMMFVPKGNVDDITSNQVEFNYLIAIIAAFIVGIGSGIVGAAGAFLLVPIMLVILKIPTRVTIASSLAITFLSSIGSTIGKVITDQVLYGPAAVMIIASLIAAPLGANAGKKINTKILQAILAILILVTAVKIWIDII
ncbi:sulfite exporter TauE/SafE family protein [Bacillus sp. FJAT-49705]|uniref:Probable membrane transporter protein n=1 Tax=Cytobacillus citreus TaxID=2833586 RepID=A0ABS5NR49_9BACI|nr:sulfite exporter TauE/SafE family protein [Cytobacillus citreus]MBS4190300.1 sulfite exporter TauE/SafE family protein [Cytobacillus citreus]